MKEVEISPKIEAALVDLPKKALYPSRARIARIVGQDYWEPSGRDVSNELTVSFFDTISEYIRIAKTIGRFELRKWMNTDSTNNLSEREIKKRFLVVYILPVSHTLQGISQKTKSPTLLLDEFSIHPFNRSSCDHTIGACDAPHFLTGTARTAGDFACELTQDEKQPLFDWWGLYSQFGKLWIWLYIYICTRKRKNNSFANM